MGKVTNQYPPVISLFPRNTIQSRTFEYQLNCQESKCSLIGFLSALPLSCLSPRATKYVFAKWMDGGVVSLGKKLYFSDK